MRSSSPLAAGTCSLEIAGHRICTCAEPDAALTCPFSPFLQNLERPPGPLTTLYVGYGLA